MEQPTQICPVCKTGKDTYALDPKEVLCPNIGQHKGNICGAFVPLGGQSKPLRIFSSEGLNIIKNF